MARLKPFDQGKNMDFEKPDLSDRQNLADTATVTEPRVISTSTPLPANLSDPGKLGQTGWFQQSMIMEPLPRRGSPITTFLLAGAGVVLGVGALVWLFLN